MQPKKTLPPLTQWKRKHLPYAVEENKVLGSYASQFQSNDVYWTPGMVKVC